jgi:RHS repeat-associated protein
MGVRFGGRALLVASLLAAGAAGGCGGDDERPDRDASADDMSDGGVADAATDAGPDGNDNTRSGPCQVADTPLQYVAAEGCWAAGPEALSLAGACEVAVKSSEPWLVATATSDRIELSIDLASTEPKQDVQEAVLTITAGSAEPIERRVTLDYRASMRGRAETTLSYDPAGRVTALKDADDRELTFEYDEVALTAIHDPTYDEPSTFEYGERGELRGTQSAHGRTDIEHDVLGRPSEIANKSGGRTLAVGYSWDAADRVSEVRYPSGRRVVYEYDTASRLVRIRDFAPDATKPDNTTYSYAGSRLETRKLPNGVVTHYGYTSQGELERVAHEDSDGDLIVRYEYERDANGRPTVVREVTADDTAKTTYAYDRLGRLTREEQPDGTVLQFEYDAAGNRTRLAHTASNGSKRETRYCYGGDNRLLMAGDEVFEHDRSGRVTRRTAGDGSTRSYSYDTTGRLLAAESPEHTVRYRYSATGERLARITDGERADLAHAGLLPSLVHHDDGDTSTDLVRGHEAFAQHTSSGQRYLLTDGLGSTRRVLDGRGRVVQELAYDAFGSPLGDAPDPATPGFAGEMWGGEEQLVFLRARYYDPALGRFLSPDPIAGDPLQPQRPNPYVYVRNGPTYRIDPTGLQSEPPGSNISRVGTAFSVGTNLWDMTHAFVGLVRANLGRGPAGNFQTLFLMGAFNFVVGDMLGLGLSAIPSPYFQLASAHATPVIMPWALKKLGLGAARGIASGTMGTVAGWAFVTWGIASAYMALERAYPDSAYAYFVREHPLRLGVEYWSDRYYESKIWEQGDAISSQGMARSAQQADALHSSGFGDTPFAFPTFEPSDPGGVYLDTSQAMLTGFEKLLSARFDPDTGGLLVVTDQGEVELPDVDLCMFTSVLKAVYAGTVPGVSIGTVPAPAPGLQGVEYFGLDNTYAGWVAFEADRLLKGLSIGWDNCDSDLALVEDTFANVPGYTSLMDRYFETVEHDVDNESHTRMWFYPGRIEIGLSDDGKTMVFHEEELKVLTETALNFDDLGTQLCDIDADCLDNRMCHQGFCVDREAVEFASHFTEHFDEFAATRPVFGELKRVMRIASIARFLHDHGAEIDVSWLEDQAECRYPTPYATCEYGRALTRWDGNTGYQIRMVGGVEMRIQNNETPDDAFAQEVTGELMGGGPDQTSPFDVLLDSNTSDGVARPLSLNRTPKDGDFSKIETDLVVAVPGDVPLRLDRYYHSFDATPSVAGRGFHIEPYRLRLTTPRQSYLVEGEEEPRTAHPQLALVDRTRGSETTFDLRGFGEDDVVVYGHGSGEQYVLIEGNNGGTRFYEVLLPSGHVLRFFADGQLLQVLGRLEVEEGTRAGFHYEWEDNLPVAITHSSGSKIVLSYDAERRLTQAEALNPDGETDGRSVSYVHDDDRLVEATDWTDRHRAYAYDSMGLLRRTTYDGIRGVKRTLDAYGRVTERQSAFGAATHSAYDLQARTTTMRDADDNLLQTVEFDEQWRPVKIVDAAGGERQVAWDDTMVGAVASRTAATGAELHYSHDEDGNLVEVRRDAPDGPLLAALSWETHGNAWLPASHLDGRGTLTSFTYDERGRLVSLDRSPADDSVDPTRMSFEYPDPLTQTWTDAAGGSHRLVRDARGRVTSVENAQGESLEVRWTERDLVKRVITETGTLRAEYDANRLTKITAETSDASRSSELTYTEAGQLASISDPSGGITRYTYDEHGRIESMRDAEQGTTSYGYDDHGRLASIDLPNGTRVTYAYDLLGRLVAERRELQ